MVGRALTLFLFLAIAVASVGLFGMAAHAAQERTKEIGIRKVFGASPSGLIAMLLRDFAKPIAIAFLLSVPIAYGLATHWLQEFAYRVEIGVGPVLAVGCAVLRHCRADGGAPSDASGADQSDRNAAH